MSGVDASTSATVRPTVVRWERPVALVLYMLAAMTGLAGARGLIDGGLAALCAAALLVGGCYLLLAAALSAKEVAVVATMASLAAAGRVAFAAIPSVQPATVLVIVTGYVFGPGTGFLVGATTALASNFFLGQGPWTIWQMLAWGLVGAASGLLGRTVKSIGTWGLVVFSVAAGLVFGWFMNLWFWLSFIYPHTVQSFLAAYATSLWFDLAHAAGNAVLAAVVGPRALSILAGFRARFHVSYEEIANA